MEEEEAAKGKRVWGERRGRGMVAAYSSNISLARFV